MSTKAGELQTQFDQALGRTATPLIDHKLVFCAVDSPDEAVYVATMINSTPIQDLLASFSNAIAVAPQTLRRLPIPDFDLQQHQEVVEVGRQAIQSAARDDDVELDDVDAAVIGALSLTDYVAQPSRERRERAEQVEFVEEPLPGLR